MGTLQLRLLIMIFLILVTFILVLAIVFYEFARMNTFLFVSYYKRPFVKLHSGNCTGFRCGRLFVSPIAFPGATYIILPFCQIQFKGDVDTGKKFSICGRFFQGQGSVFRWNSKGWWEPAAERAFIGRSGQPGANQGCEAHKRRTGAINGSSPCKTAFHLKNKVQGYENLHCLTKPRRYKKKSTYDMIPSYNFDYSGQNNFCKLFFQNFLIFFNFFWFACSFRGFQAIRADISSERWE